MQLKYLILMYKIISQIQYKNKDNELSTELKVKLINYKISLGKYYKQFKEDVALFSEQIISPEMRNLAHKNIKSDEENKLLNELRKQYSNEQKCYIKQKSNEIINSTKYSITDEEFQQIVLVNLDNEAEINGNKLSAPEFLEIIYNLFVR